MTRPELVAFINTLHRLSESLGAIDKFRLLWRQRSEDGTLPSSEKAEREDAGESETAAKRAKVEAGLGPRASVGGGRDEGGKKRRRAKKKKQKASTAPARPSSQAAEVGATGQGPAQQDALSRLFDRCRSSWAVCFHWLERAISTLLGTASLANGRRSRVVGGGEL